MKRAARVIAISLATWVIGVAACERYEPPSVTLEGLASGTLDDPRAPLVVDFGMAIEPSTAKFEVAYFDLDSNGNLPDESGDPNAQLRTLFTHDAFDGDVGGTTTFSADGSSASLAPAGAFPVGPRLVLLVEPGLRSTDGRTRTFRTRVPFSYAVKCSGAGSTHFQSGAYFLMLQIEQPIGATLKMFGVLDVDPASGALAGQVTGGFRNTDGSRCPGGCASTDACRTIPSAECVAPSTPPGSVDEYPDFVFNAVPPIGYTFEIHGCAVDADPANANGGVNVLTLPATMVVEQPAVTIQGLTMTAQFAAGANGLVHATGSLSSDATILGTAAVGAGVGTMNAIRIPDDQVLPGLPQPPASDADLDAGATSP